MKPELLLLPRAEADLDNIFTYLALNASVEIAIRFDEAVFSSFKRLQEMPLKGSDRSYFNTVLSGIRMWFVQKFEEYLIFYLVSDDVVLIVRVLHASQNAENIISFEGDY